MKISGHNLSHWSPVYRVFVMLIIGLLLIPSGSVAASRLTSELETSYHTITIDGDLTDWASDELMETDGSNTLYLTWDATNIYLGLSGPYLGDGLQDKSFFVCFDTILTPGSGAGADGYANLTFNKSFFAPEYCYYFAGATGLYEWSTWNGSSWTWNGWRSDGTYYNQPSNPATMPGSEFTILRSDIDNPSSMRVAAWTTPETPIPGPIESSWPTRNPTGSAPTITFSYNFPLLGSGISPNASVNQVSINEIRTDHTGTDVQEYFELYGPASLALNGLTYLVIGDGTGASGVLENVTNLGATTIPASGYFIAATSAYNLTIPDLVASLVFENSDNVTHLVVKGFTGALGQDLDTNDNGVLDLTPWSEVVDLIALVLQNNPPATTEYHYGPPNIGPDGIYVPGHVFWCADTWQIGQFDLAGGDDTPGQLNCQPELTIDKSGPLYASPGDEIEYIFSIENYGNLEAETVTLIDTLPTGVSFLSDDSGYSCPACIPGAIGTLTWDLGTLPTTFTDTFTLTVLISNSMMGGTTITNQVGISTPDPESYLGDNSDQVMTSITELDLVVDKVGPSFAAIGEMITYTINIENFGVNIAENVVITDALPVGVTYLSDDSGFVPSNPAPGEYVWIVGDLPDNSAIEFQLVGIISDSVAPDTGLTNTVMVTTETPGDDNDNNQDHVTTTAFQLVPINQIQGAAHISPMNDMYVEYTYGIVTVVRYNGFYMQNPYPDGDEETSEALFVYTGSAPGRLVGDEVLVAGTVTEFRPGGTGGLNNLTLTQITGPTVVLMSTSNPLPPYTILGTGGRIPPSQVIDDDATGDVETSGTFDVASDGIDFYESVECMLVQVNNAVAVAATNTSYGEIAVVGDLGANSSLMNPRGGIVIQSSDFNPERIIVDDTIISSEPQVNSGDLFTAPIVGVMDYSFGNFKLYNTSPMSVSSADLQKEISTLPAGDDQILIATFNVYNLDLSDGTAKFDALATEIVTHLLSPDIIVLEEVQDNNGATNDTVVDASLVYQALVDAILAAGGPTYEFRDISPVDDQDGGEPGANIRVGFLYRSDRGLSFIDRPGGDATTPVTVTIGTQGVELSYSPGRIDPNNSAFLDSRKPLAGEFLYNGYKLIVIGNHLNSKTGDQPLFGHFQPPVLSSEEQRIAQATVINNFVQEILSLDPQANVVVLGDLNDFQFSEPITTLAGNELSILANILPAEERYSYVYDGNSQALEQILVTAALTPTAELDVVHTNAEFLSSLRPTDHDPAVARFTLLPASVMIAKAVTPEVDVPLGSVVTYTILLENDQPAFALDIMMTDTLPAEVTFGGWIQDNGAVLEGDLITWSGDLAGGTALTFIFTATLDVDTSLYGQSIGNTASFTSTDVGGGQDSAVFVVEDPPIVSIDKSVEPIMDIPIGSVVTYTINLSSVNNSQAWNVVMTDVLPAKVTFGGWIQDNGATLVGDQIFWEGDIPGETALTFIFTATLDTDTSLYGQSIPNSAYYIVPGVGGGHDMVTFVVEDPPVVSISKDVVPLGDVALGGTVTYTIQLVNANASQAWNVVMTDVLPAEVTFNGWIEDHGAILIGDMIQWEGDLPGTSTLTFIFTATLDYDYALYLERIVNTAFVNVPGVSADSAEVGFVVTRAPLLFIEKSVVAMEWVPLGEVVTYTITLENRGGDTAVGVVMTDVLPTGITFGSWIEDNGAAIVDGMVNWEGEVPPTATLGFIFTATMNLDPEFYGQMITNTASFTSLNDGEGTASASFVVIPGPDLSIEKTVSLSNDPVSPGDVVIYTIVVNNNGVGDALGVHILDILPAGMSGDDLDVMVDITSGDSYTITLTATVDMDVQPGAEIINTVVYEHLSGSGSASVSFYIRHLYKIFLPVLFNH